MHKYQYTICFNNEFTYELLKQKGKVDYRSLVVNVLFLTSELSMDELININGVTNVTRNYYKKYSNKKESRNYY